MNDPLIARATECQTFVGKGLNEGTVHNYVSVCVYQTSKSGISQHALLNDLPRVARVNPQVCVLSVIPGKLFNGIVQARPEVQRLIWMIQGIAATERNAGEITAPFALIVWFDLTRVYDEAANRNTEYIKAQILRVLNGRAGWHLTGGRIVLNRIYERAENIYRGYSLSEVDNQFLMHPFAGFRFEGNLQFEELCFD